MSHHTHFMSSLFNLMSQDIHFMSRLVYFMSPCTTRMPHIFLTWGAWDRQADGQAVVCWHRHPKDVVADMMEDDSMAGQFQGRYAPDTVTDRFGAVHRIFASVGSGLWMQHWSVKRGGGEACGGGSACQWRRVHSHRQAWMSLCVLVCREQERSEPRRQSVVLLAGSDTTVRPRPLWVGRVHDAQHSSIQSAGAGDIRLCLLYTSPSPRDSR